MEEEDLILKYQMLIYKIAKKFYNVEIDDLFQAGSIGLIKAYRKFDSEKSPDFISFAYKYIFGEMYELANKSRDIKLNKTYLKIYKALELARQKLLNVNNAEPSIEEICSYLNLDENIVGEVISLTAKMMSLDDEFSSLNGENLRIEECIGKEENFDDQILIEDSINNLAPIEQEVIKIRYFEDFTQMETAEKLGISQVKVSRIEQRGKQKIKEYISA